MLSCPHCGAAVKADSRQCAYCQGLLQTVACPKCLAMMFAGSEFCPTCGARTQVMAAEGQTAHQCPRCGVEGRMLERVTLGESLVEECRQCGGMWVDARRFERICADAQAQVQSSEALTGGAPQIPHMTPERQVRYIHCPLCHEMMNRVNFGMRSGVVIDVCKGHGIWLDKDELQEIIAFIRAGGLQQAQEMAAQRAQSERLQMISQQESPAVAQRYAASQSAGGIDGTGLVGAILSVAWDAVFGGKV